MEIEKLKKIIIRPTDPYQRNRVVRGNKNIFKVGLVSFFPGERTGQPSLFPHNNHIWTWEGITSDLSSKMFHVVSF